MTPALWPIRLSCLLALLFVFWSRHYRTHCFIHSFSFTSSSTWLSLSLEARKHKKLIMVVLHFCSFFFFSFPWQRESRPAPTWCLCGLFFFISSVLSSCCHGLLFISLITAPLRWSFTTLFSSAHASEHKHAHRTKHAHSFTHTLTQLMEQQSLTAASFEAAPI